MSKISEIIKNEVCSRGVIPFARFMELALYCPDYGYYERESDTVGRSGDFYTSVSVGPLFGELLAWQIAAWLAQLPGERLQIVEAGAHDGKLAADILGWMQRCRPELFNRIEYVICEPSARRRVWQERRLHDYGRKVRWIEDELGRTPGVFRGVILANELLDALPVHRLGWDAQQRTWFEWGVAWDGVQFVWARMDGVSDSLILPPLPAGLDSVLPDGFVLELCPAAAEWWRDAALALRSGWLLTLDYGLGAEGALAAHRNGGTLRAYQNHRVSSDLLARPGEQDLTAQVDFSRVQQVGESLGLRTEQCESQAKFLVEIGEQFWPEADARGEWTTARKRNFRTLIHPEHLGRAFKVLVQRRVLAAELADNAVGHIA
jgi:SAM-dependent MidA family methyltransferase